MDYFLGPWFLDGKRETFCLEQANSTGFFFLSRCMMNQAVYCRREKPPFVFLALSWGWQYVRNPSVERTVISHSVIIYLVVALK